MTQNFTVNIGKTGKSCRVAKGTDLLSAAMKCGFVLNTACGGEGLCGKCKVILTRGRVKAASSRLISEAEKMAGYVLGCQTFVEGDCDIEIPESSLVHVGKIACESEEFTKGVVLEREDAYKHSPLVRKVYLELAVPTADDNASDLDRIFRELDVDTDEALFSTKLASVKYLSETLRSSDFKVTAVLGYRDSHLELLAVEPGDTSKANYGLAFDIGTTTVVGQLIDMNTKDILGTRIAFNKQAQYGSDIITRIIYASQPDGLERMNELVSDNIDEIIEDLTAANKVSMSDIYAITFAGNMTMMHLLLKIDPSNIRKAPYIPTTSSFPTVHASEIGLELNQKGLAAFLPGVSTYVGGDIVAGVLACGLCERPQVSILADIGTNGEIVLGNNEWMVGSAASAGPAFEGSGLSCGMKAVRGAICKVTIDEKHNPGLETIENEKPRGICGSGYIDLLCQMLKARLITKDGKIDRESKSKRIRKGQDCYEYVLSFKEDTRSQSDIVVTEDDIENLKRAKGAVYSAIMSLVNKMGKDISDIDKIYIAGGFGNYLNIENSIFIGMFPDVRRDVYEFIGNSSLAGARMTLLSREAALAANRIHKNITYVDLSSEPGYMDEYVAALFFPHTDRGRFPSVQL